MSDTFTKALEGDRDAQLVNIVYSLAMHIRCLRSLPMLTPEVRLSMDELCDAALEYISAPPPPKPRCGSCRHWSGTNSRGYGVCAKVIELSGNLLPKDFGCVRHESKL